MMLSKSYLQSMLLAAAFETIQSIFASIQRFGKDQRLGRKRGLCHMRCSGSDDGACPLFGCISDLGLFDMNNLFHPYGPVAVAGSYE